MLLLLSAPSRPHTGMPLPLVHRCHLPPCSLLQIAESPQFKSHCDPQEMANVLQRVILQRMSEPRVVNPACKALCNVALHMDDSDDTGTRELLGTLKEVLVRYVTQRSLTVVACKALANLTVKPKRRYGMYLVGQRSSCAWKWVVSK